ncbi:F-box protein SKIP23 [Bienertia sinuspersici]
MSELQRRKVDWSLLPEELLEKIAYCTESRIELLRFLAVCKKWRSSYSASVSNHLLYPTLPKLIPILSSSIFIQSNRPIYLIGSGLYFIQSQNSDPNLSYKSWVVSVEELNRFQPCCNYPTKSKVVMFHDDDSPTIDTWSVMVLLLNQGGTLGTLKLNGRWKYIDLGPGIHFDDVISLRRNGQLCAIDREGRAYLIDGSECRVIRTMSEPLCKTHPPLSKTRFEVFLLKEEDHCWISMTDMGDWILFLMFDNVFVVKAKRIPGCKGNCIVFPKNLFSLHSQEFCEDYKLFEGASKYMEVGVYFLGEDHCRLVASEPGFSDLNDYSSSLYSLTSEGEVFPDSTQNIEDTQDAQSLAQLHNIEDKSQQEIPNETNNVPVSVDTSCEHGNIIENNVIASNGLMTWALESLANMILILQSNTGTSLNEVQAEYLKSTLIDLQSMNFRLGWLVPYVEKALTLYKNKEQIDTIAKLETRKSELLTELNETVVRVADLKKLVGEA